jgi:hypothetical protein
MDDEARVNRISVLREKLSTSEESQLVHDFLTGATTYHVFQGNELELREFLLHHERRENALPLWNVENREGFQSFLREVSRLLHNYLASVGSLRDHTRRLWNKYLPPEEYREKARVTFAESGLCVFVQNLRDYSLHRKLPVAYGHMFFDQDELVAAVKLDRADLLKWSKWPPLAKGYLTSLPEDDIDLRAIVDDYTTSVRDFNHWFGQTFVQHKLEAFQQFSAWENELSDAFADLYRYRAEVAQAAAPDS